MKRFRDTNYFVDENGSIFRNGKKLKVQSHKTGYLFFKMNGDGMNNTFYIHRMVAECYIPNTNKLSDLNHIDGNKHNCSVSNLEWVSHKENMRHAIEMGLIDRRGEKCSTSKLTEEQIKDIRTNYVKRSADKNARHFSEKYGVSQQLIHLILQRKRWGWLD